MVWTKASLENSASGHLLNNSKRVVIAISNDSVTLSITESVPADAGFYMCQFPGAFRHVVSDSIHVVISG